MTRIPSNAVRVALSPLAGALPTRVQTVKIDQIEPGKTESAARKFGELKAAISPDLVGHGSDGEPFFALGSFKEKRSEAELLAALASRLFAKRSETADRHDFLAGGADEALRAFGARGESLRENVPEELVGAFDEAVSRTRQFFFNKALFAEVRAVETSTHGAQFGREALTLVGRAHTGEWFFVAVEIVG